MPAPSTVDEFVELIRKSGIVEEARLNACLQKLVATEPLPAEPAQAATMLVRDGLLTHFQAEQLLLGKWRRFTIGKYRVLERLGSGGMGSVYLCEHIYMRRRVAVKVLPTAKAEEHASLERFYREARAVAALDHPNIVRAYDIDQDGDLHFLVMEYIDGSSLQEMVKRGGPLDINRAVHYIRQTAAGLEHAHRAAGLVHRDVKPGNILVDRKGQVKVLDLGLARFFHDEDAPITQKFDESILGTADYLAPEQALDSHNVDIRVDIYSLGATLYFCLTGNTPFEGTAAQKLIWHQTRQPKPVREIRPEIPEGVAAILEKMMAKDPADRFQTPADVEAALEPYDREAIPPPPEKEMPRLSPAAQGGGIISEVPYRQPMAPVPEPLSRRWETKPPARSSTALSAGSQSKVSTIVSATGQATPTAVMPSAADANAQNGASVAWEKSASETEDASARADTEPTPPLRGPVPQTIAQRVPRTVWWAAGGILVGLLCLFSWQAFTRAPATPIRIDDEQRTSQAPMVWNVTHITQPNSFKTVREALYQAKPGDRIVVLDEQIEEALIAENVKWGKDVIIQAGNAHGSVRWRCPANPKYGKFISLSGTDGLRLTGFILDANGQVDDALALAGPCARMSIDNVQIQGFKRDAISLWNCSGVINGGELTLKQVRMVTDHESDAGISFNSLDSGSAALNQEIVVENCRFEGPFRGAVRVSAPTAHVAFRGNRFFRSIDGFLYERSLPPYRLHIGFDTNTFYGMRNHGLHFQTLPLTGDNSRVDVTENVFAETPALAQVDEAERLSDAKDLFKISGNVRDSASKEGNLSLHATRLDFQLSTDPANDGSFLRWPRNTGSSAQARSVVP